MRLKLAIVCGSSSWSSYLSRSLSRIFSDEIEMIEYNGDKNLITESVKADLILVTQPIIYYAANKFFDPSTPTVSLTNTITKQQYETVRAIPAGTRVLVVNDDDDATMQTISKFQELGLTHLEYYPYSTTVVTDEVRPTVAITPGEPDLVPDYIEKIIDIGERAIDPHCITEIAIYLGLEHLLKMESVVKYVAETCMSENSLSYLLNRSLAISEVFLSLMDSLGEGILLVDRMGLVQSCNSNAANIMGKPKEVVGKHIGLLLPCDLTENFNRIHHDSDVQLVHANNTAITLRIVPIKTDGSPCGALVEVNTFEKKERQQRHLRRQILEKGHVAKRTFDNIITVNPEMLQLKIMAEKHAKSTATILITGESGTGKEVLAQAIHNASSRKNCPFVALNCAALPRDLLESELFGYEEGAFTGAKKGGKIGLFELATTGTIFLDEIGDMDLNLQTRILRVLEEHEVLRIGGDSTCPVDIRVIAATNQDLWNLISEGKFRKDLYYRLHVIPLELKPLRQRSDDILLLFQYFAKLKGCTFTLSPEAEQCLISYPWYGNVRELRNWVEYLSVLDLNYFDAEALKSVLYGRQKQDEAVLGLQPPIVPEKNRKAEEETPSASRLNQEQELMLQGFQDEVVGKELYYYLVMKALVSGHGQGVGRHAIFEDIQRGGYQLSEVEIRKTVSVLCRYHLAIQGAGRMGTRITSLGIAAFDSMQQNQYFKKMLNFLDN